MELYVKARRAFLHVEPPADWRTGCQLIANRVRCRAVSDSVRVGRTLVSVVDDVLKLLACDCWCGNCPCGNKPS